MSGTLAPVDPDLNKSADAEPARRDLMGRMAAATATRPIPDVPVFDGADYVPIRDNPRLTGQLRSVWDCMADGAWRSLPEISKATGAPEASVSAQLRHLRKERFGAHTVERRFDEGKSLYYYRVIPNVTQKAVA